MSASLSPAPPSVIGRLPKVAVVLGLALLLGLSVFPPSSTRLQAWPWAFYAAFGWFLPIAVALFRVAFNRPYSRFGGLLDVGFVSLAAAATASVLVSPLRGAVLPHLLPVLGTCALPYALLPCFAPTHITRTWRMGGALLGVVIGTSLLLWIQPWNGFAGLGSRNAQPFGHANITGSVAVLATTWCIIGAVRETARARVWFCLGAALAVASAVSSGSRGAVLALAAAGATAAALILLRRGQRLLLIVSIVLIVGGAVASNARLRELITQGSWSADASESNAQRTAMIVGGLRLGAERPLFGWGAGSVPHVFPRVRADLPGTADNFLQLHNTPAQLWATLGIAGFLTTALITFSVLGRLLTVPWTPERIAVAAALAGAAAMLLFDHPFSTPIFAVLAAAHLTAWASPTQRGPERALRDSRARSDPAPQVSAFRSQPSGLCRQPSVLTALALGLALLAPALYATARDLLARSAHSAALDAVAAQDPNAYAEALHRATRHAPGDPYHAHQLAAHLATGRLFSAPSQLDPAAAVELLRTSLAANPDLEYAHYNLGWLLLDQDSAASAAHFLHAARLAPERGAVYWGLGLARIRLGDTEGAVRAFATEWLLNPAFAWSPIWWEAPLVPLRPRIQALASEAALARGADPWAFLTTPASYGPAYRRLRTGYGVLMGHPEGVPPIDINIQQRLVLPESSSADVESAPRFSGRQLLDFLHAPAR